ncbi:MAG: hypothetical protein ACT4OO_15205 [Nitrospiraceae bacterium]
MEPDKSDPRQEPPSGEQSDTNFLSNEQAWTAIIIGLVLLVALYAISTPSPAPSKPEEKSSAGSVTRLLPEMVPLVSGEEPIPELFSKAGCPVCHTIPGIPGAEGRVGPALLLGTTGPQRLADPGYQGKAKTVREYVVESILTPGAYVAPGFSDGVMPRWYGKKLSATALETIAAYLEQLRATTPTSGG